MNYKDKEIGKYKDWEKEMDEVNYGVYVLAGDHVWKKEVSDRFKNVLGSRAKVVNSGLKDMVDRMAYGTMSRKKHFVMFEAKRGKFAKEELTVLGEYLMKPSEHAVLVIYAADRSELNFLLERFKMLKKSNYVKFFDMTYVSNVFKEMVVLDRVNAMGIRCESSKVKTDMVKNLTMSLEDLEDNLLTLSTLGDGDITKEDLKENLETYSDYTVTKLLDTLVKVNRKKVPYVVLEELIGQGMPARKLLVIIRNHFRLVYQAKLLKYKGIMRERDLVDEKKDLFDRQGISFGEKSIWDVSDFKRNRLLSDSDEITTKEIVYCLQLVEGKLLVQNGNSFRNVGHMDVYQCVIEIMERRNDLLA